MGAEDEWEHGQSLGSIIGAVAGIFVCCITADAFGLEIGIIVWIIFWILMRILIDGILLPET